MRAELEQIACCSVSRTACDDEYGEEAPAFGETTTAGVACREVDAEASGARLHIPFARHSRGNSVVGKGIGLLHSRRARSVGYAPDSTGDDGHQGSTRCSWPRGDGFVGESREYEREFAAAYRVADRRVKVESGNEFGEETLLFVMGHECAHAMFFQGGFLEHNPDMASYQHLVHEVAADVLGALLAGRVVSRRGEDGAALTRNLIEETQIVGRRYPISPSAIKKHISTEWDGNVRTYVGERLLA